MWHVSMQSNDLPIDAPAGLFSILDKRTPRRSSDNRNPVLRIECFPGNGSTEMLANLDVLIGRSAHSVSRTAGPRSGGRWDAQSESVYTLDGNSGQFFETRHFVSQFVSLITSYLSEASCWRAQKGLQIPISPTAGGD